MPGPGHTPEVLKHCVRAVAAKGKDTSSAFAICTASLQKAGYLEPGSSQPTAAGKKLSRKHAKEPEAGEKRDDYEKLLKGRKSEARLLIKTLRMALVEGGWSERIPGGLSSGMSPEDFDPIQLAAGIEVEMEHTTDPAIATEIAMDHLAEDPDYYVKLKKMEKD